MTMLMVNVVDVLVLTATLYWTCAVVAAVVLELTHG